MKKILLTIFLFIITGVLSYSQNLRGRQLNIIDGTDTLKIDVDNASNLTTFWSTRLKLYLLNPLDVTGTINTLEKYEIDGMNALSFPHNSTNIAIGEGAGLNISNNANTCIGYQSGYTTTSGSHNTFLGYQAGFSNTSGYNNIFVGSNAGYHNTTGIKNIFVGHFVGFFNTTGANNTFIGYHVGYHNSTGSYNTFLGDAAGYKNTTGVDNTFLGDAAGFSNTIGSYNTFLGDAAGNKNTTGNNNTFLGYLAGRNNSTGDNNVFLGYNAGYNELGSDKLYIENSNSTTPLIYGEFDNDLLRVNGTLDVTEHYEIGGDTIFDTYGTGNIRLGWNAGRGVNPLTYQQLTFVGNYAGYGNTSSSVTAIGSWAGYLNSGDGCTFVGKHSGDKNSGFNNIAIGHSAGGLLGGGCSGNYNTCVGNEALETITTGERNTVVGNLAGESILGGSRNCLFGKNSGDSLVSGSGNCLFGYDSGRKGIDGSDNVGIGRSVLLNNLHGDDNVAIGSYAGNNNVGNRNIFIGFNAGYNEIGHDKLYIENSNSATPLIYGDFANDTVRINGVLDLVANSITGTSVNLTNLKLQYLSNIDNAIGTTQWNYLAELNQSVMSSASPIFEQLTLSYSIVGITQFFIKNNSGHVDASIRNNYRLKDASGGNNDFNITISKKDNAAATFTTKWVFNNYLNNVKKNWLTVVGDSIYLEENVDISGNLVVDGTISGILNYYGEMGNVYGSSATEALATANEVYAMYHTNITGSAPHLNNGFTFVAGKAGSGNITSDGGGIKITDAAHGLLVDDIICVQSANQTDIYTVTSVNVGDFTTDGTWSHNEASTWQMGSYLLVTNSGRYRGMHTGMMSQSLNNTQTTHIVPYVNITIGTKAYANGYLKNNIDICPIMGNGLMNFTAGDRLWFGIKSTAAQTITFTVRNLSIR